LKIDLDNYYPRLTGVGGILLDDRRAGRKPPLSSVGSSLSRL
jgi:hypothetical protein